MRPHGSGSDANSLPKVPGDVDKEIRGVERNVRLDGEAPGRVPVDRNDRVVGAGRRGEVDYRGVGASEACRKDSEVSEPDRHDDGQVYGERLHVVRQAALAKRGKGPARAVAGNRRSAIG